MALLELNDLCKSYGVGENQTEVLKDINLHIQEGEFVAIVGFTGSGKTTLINMISGLLEPTSGELLLRGKKIEGPGHDRSVIFQNYSLLPWLNVFENVMLSINQVYPEWSTKEKEAHAKKYIEMVNLTPALNKKPGELSGGMKQRTSVARSLAMSPDILLMDEPLSALDALTRGNLQEEILNIWSQNKKTALLITNDVDEGIFMADRIIPLNPGPKATLGPEFKIDIERPRDKTELNDNELFKSTRNQIIEYLMDLGSDAQSKNGKEIKLPDLKPSMPAKGFRFRSAS